MRVMVIREYLLRRRMSTDRWPLIVLFRCDVISCELARHSVRRGADETSACASICHFIALGIHVLRTGWASIVLVLLQRRVTRLQVRAVHVGSVRAL